VPEQVLDQLTLHLVSDVAEVISLALEPALSGERAAESRPAA
jgi:hypothetical protein